MNVFKYLEDNKPDKYIITNRVRTPISDETLKYLDLKDLKVQRTEDKHGTLYIYTDYIADSC